MHRVMRTTQMQTLHSLVVCLMLRLPYSRQGTYVLRVCSQSSDLRNNLPVTGAVLVPGDPALALEHVYLRSAVSGSFGCYRPDYRSALPAACRQAQVYQRRGKTVHLYQTPRGFPPGTLKCPAAATGGQPLAVRPALRPLAHTSLAACRQVQAAS